MHESGDRLFSIQNHRYDFFTGVLADGRQVVLGTLSAVVAYFFDPDGNFVSREERHWSPAAAEALAAAPPYGEFAALAALQRQEWEGEFGFRTATIRVKQFFDRDHGVGIEPLPGHFRDVEPPEWFTNAPARRRYTERRDQWLADGKFVWYWGKGYFMSGAGEIEST